MDVRYLMGIDTQIPLPEGIEINYLEVQNSFDSKFEQYSSEMGIPSDAGCFYGSFIPVHKSYYKSGCIEYHTIIIGGLDFNDGFSNFAGHDTINYWIELAMKETSILVQCKLISHLQGSLYKKGYHLELMQFNRDEIITIGGIYAYLQRVNQENQISANQFFPMGIFNRVKDCLVIPLNN